MVDHSKSKKLLIIGGTSILSDYLAQLAKKEDYEIEITSRSEKKCKYADNQFKLDLSDQSNILEFLNHTEFNSYRRIVVLTGETSRIEVKSDAKNEIDVYYATHLANTVFLLDKIVKNLENPGNLIYMSSIAAIKSSYDCHYSAVKAGVSAYIRSRSRFLDRNQSMVSIAPSLIDGTRMYLEMSPETIASHLVRNRGRLTSPDEVSKFIWALQPESTVAINGQMISVGNEY